MQKNTNTFKKWYLFPNPYFCTIFGKAIFIAWKVFNHEINMNLLWNQNDNGWCFPKKRNWFAFVWNDLWVLGTTMLQKFSKCEVKAWLCWNLMILLPIRFCVKIPILVISEGPKMSFLAILETLNFNFCQF